ncbi:DUF1269 domain-containing protein [Collimonas arenae]|uniref:DUF1269 domain-containing protein n=1 Tax=Collimonas arenae TaxID=279058 RepID=UPI001F263FD4|nr:DUF1269 domain-containing protein [Collimonas arenae]
MKETVMLGRQRLYFMLPDIPSARSTLDELLLARVGIQHIHFWGTEGKLPADMPEANVLHKTDLANGAEVGLLAGGVIGLVLGMWLVYFPPQWVHLNWLAMVATTLAGAVLGSWMSGMAAAALPNSRLKSFHAGIEEARFCCGGCAVQACGGNRSADRKASSGSVFLRRRETYSSISIISSD